MLCPRCGTDCPPEYKFCKSCGATMGAAGNAPAAAPPVAPPAYGQAPQASAGYPPQQGPPPGMVAMLHQAYPGGPPQVYYVPAHGGAQPHEGVLGNLRTKIRELASTDKLEGFSLKELFNETFKKRGTDSIEEYLAVGSPRTTPPLELVDTNWPKPWMFFRVLAGLAIAYGAFYALWLFSMNEKVLIGIIVLATFAVPVATMTLIWEMNTPRNVSIGEVLEVFVIGGGLSIVVTTLWYLVPIFGNLPGIVEESSKLLAVIAVTYSARGARYPYQLNGILFGAAVGAGFACSETLGYGVDAALGFVTGGGMQHLPPGATLGTVLVTLMKTIVGNLDLRGLESPFGHPMFTAIAAGAFWRVKGDRPANLSMLIDGRFLRAFIIPVILHTTWDIQILIPTLNGIVVMCLQATVAVVGWYVVFTMIQQGLHQVRDMQKAQLQSTLHTVEATLGLGTMRPPMPMVAPGVVAPH